MQLVTVEIQGGIITHITAPDGIQVRVIDHDLSTDETHEPDTFITE